MNPKSLAAIFLYFALIASIAIYTFKKPNYNWDMIPYMVIVLQYNHLDFDKAHDSVYNTLRQKLPTANYEQLTDAGIPFRKKVFERRDEFYKELPFYAVKPLYTFTAFTFNKLGVPLIQCTVLPSTICFLFIGVFLLLWTKRYMSLPAACTLCFLIISTSIMLAVARNSTPDCISALFIFGSVYFLLERKNIIWSTVFILLSISARIDNVIFACLLLGLIAITANNSNQTRLKTGLLFIFLIAISFFSTTLTVLPFHWSPLFYPNFAQSMNTSYSVHHSFSLHDYIEVAKSHFMTGLFFSNTALFIVLGYLALDKSPSRDDRYDLQNKILFLFLLAIMIRFVFQPNIDDRFYIGYYLCILCFLIKNQFTSRRIVHSRCHS